MPASHDSSHDASRDPSHDPADSTRDGAASQRCSIAACERTAVASCFECERFCCERHLRAISLVTATRPVRVRVCPTCLHRYSIDPELQPLLRYDFMRLSPHNVHD